ncbi:protein of unknown function [uncultured Sphingopyxis sp.]|uniref:Uncharacterized protein n=1 Tax=uncultured Sphingopyxis sp. TaxID=310581 RepID=A0A1Y5PU38_9SPHN|nr:protein of unknown function [uncultured Sphingopyxis sp.]
MLACQFVGRREKPEKPLRSSSLSRPINTAPQSPQSDAVETDRAGEGEAARSVSMRRLEQRVPAPVRSEF